MVLHSDFRSPLKRVVKHTRLLPAHPDRDVKQLPPGLSKQTNRVMGLQAETDVSR